MVRAGTGLHAAGRGRGATRRSAGGADHRDPPIVERRPPTMNGGQDGGSHGPRRNNANGNEACVLHGPRPAFYSSLSTVGLCANYFSSISDDVADRFYYVRTSAGITANGSKGYGIFDSGRWPIISTLDEAGVTGRFYSIAPTASSRRQQQRGRLLEPLATIRAHHRHEDDSSATLREERLPQCVGIRELDGVRRAPAATCPRHGFQQEISRRCAGRTPAALGLPASPMTSTRFFDPFAPPQLDAYGLGCGCLWVISPHAGAGS